MGEINCIVNGKSLCKRVEEHIPETKFCAKYYRDEKDLMMLLKQYKKQSFVYLLVNSYDKEKFVIYVGKSSDQYSRVLMHKSNFEFDELYLFMVSAKRQKEVEGKMIRLFSPLYNKSENEEMAKEMSMLGLEYDEFKSRERIQKDIQVFLNNHKMQVATFFLPQKYILALKAEAEEKSMGINQLLSDILQREIPMERVLQSLREDDFENEIISEMVTVEEYAAMWGKSVERVKILCREGRLSAYKQNRDWLIPRSVPYPEDRRKNSTFK